MTLTTHMNKQTFLPGDLSVANVVSVGSYESGRRELACRQRDWSWEEVLRQDGFLLGMSELYSSVADDVSYARLDDYIAVNFWLSGRHTTVLDGFGQHDHQRPEVFISSGPREMIKMHLIPRESRISTVALCVKHDFFPTHLGMAIDDLPQPLRSMVNCAGRDFAFCRFPLTPDLAAASRAVMSAPTTLRSNATYAQAKCVELMLLVCNLMEAQAPGLTAGQGDRRLTSRQVSQLQRARELVGSHHAQGITLDRLSREVGLNKTTLTSGFRSLYHMSVYECINKERMERAYALLQEREMTVGQVAEAVGFEHACNFSTAFSGYFGCTPQSVRGIERDRGKS